VPWGHAMILFVRCRTVSTVEVLSVHWLFWCFFLSRGGGQRGVICQRGPRGLFRSDMQATDVAICVEDRCSK
jgi:hypothetical protein